MTTGISARTGSPAHRSEDGPAVQIRHKNVERDRERANLPGALQPFNPAEGGDDAEPLLLKDMGDLLACRGIIIDDEYAISWSAHDVVGLRRLACIVCGVVEVGQIAKLRPVPPYRRAICVSAWGNSSNTFSSCSLDIPMPVSLTVNAIQKRPADSTRSIRSRTSPASVNLQALLKRLNRICRSRIASAVTAEEMARSRPAGDSRLFGEWADRAYHFLNQRY